MNKVKIAIRPATEKDQDAIYLIHKLAFGQDNESRLTDSLRKTKLYNAKLSLIAFLNNEAVGHILFYPLTIKTKDGVINTLGLAPLAVKPQFQNHGIGSKLVLKGIEKAKLLGYESIIVVGDPNYYQRFGFQLVKNLSNNINEPPDHFMAIELKPNALKNIQGTIEYPSEFADL